MKLRLQAKYTLAITALIVAVSLVVGVILQHHYRRSTEAMTEASLAMLDRTLTHALEEDGRELARLLEAEVGPALAANDRRQATITLEQLQERYEVLRWASIHDARGALFAATPTAPAGDASTRQGDGSVDDLIITQAVIHRDRELGVLRLALSLEVVALRRGQLESALRASQAAGLQQDRMELTGLFLLLVGLGVILGTITARRLVRPVSALARQARAFAAGDLNRPLLPVRGHDEIAELTAAFGQMRRSLAGTTVSRDFLHRIIDSLQEGLVVTSARGEIRLCNRAAADTFGRAPEELTGLPFSSLLSDFDSATTGRAQVESSVSRRGGGFTSVEVSRSPLGSGPEAEQVYVISNITARKAMEEELWVYRSRLEHLVVERTRELVTAIQELETFSYTVSHDLHAPLRAINGFGAALLEEYYDLLGESGRDYLERINGATVRMGELIDGLLTLSRVARREIHREPVDASAIASELAAEMAATDPRRQVTFRIAPTLTVMADRAMMRLLLQNLIGNAWKFSRDRRSALIEVGQTEQAGQRVLFVRDNGAGFDASAARSIFQPFNRLHSQQEFPGTGIGLATVQRIVARHDGEVWAEAQPGTGATFYFTLPEGQAVQVEERRVSSRAPLSNNVRSHRPSRTA